MNNSKVHELIKYSFSKFFQNKWFVIFNILSLLGVLFLPNKDYLSQIFNFGNDEDTYHLEVITENDFYYSELEKAFLDDDLIDVSKSHLNSYTAETIPEDVLVLEFFEQEEPFFSVKLTSKEGIKNDAGTKIKNVLNSIKSKKVVPAFNLSSDEYEKITSDVEIERVMLSVDSEDSETKNMIKLMSVFFTYMVSSLLFTRIANEIAQEKSSKSSEYILTSVSEKEYMFAKVFSNILIMLIQFLLFVAYLVMSLSILSIFKAEQADLNLGISLDSSLLNIDLIIYIVVLFILNVLTFTLLSIIQAMLAAKAASAQEAGNSVSFLVFAMMGLYIVTLFLIDPYQIVSIPVHILSCLPVFSAYFMPALMIVGQCSTLEIVISVGLLVISIPIAFNICSKLFKEGLLDYTKAKKKQEKNLTLEEKQKTFINKRTFKTIGMILGIAIIIIFAVSTIIQLVQMYIISPLLPKTISKTDNLLLVQGISQIISFYLAYLFIKMYLSKVGKQSDEANLEKTVDSQEPEEKKYNPTKLQAILICFSAVFLLNIIISCLYALFNIEVNTTDIFEITPNSSLFTKILTVLVIAIIPGILEELLFRKGIISLLQKYGALFAVVTSSLLFALIHGNLTQGIFAFVVGLVLGTTYLLTKDIKITMIVHAMNNGFQALALVSPIMIQYGLVVVSSVLVLAGLYYLIKLIIKNKVFKDLEIIKEKLRSPYSFKTSYKYILCDYIFDISMVAIFLNFILSGKVL